MSLRIVILALLAAAIALPSAAARSDGSTYIYLKTTGFYGAVDLVPSGTQVGSCTSYCTFAFTPGTSVSLVAEAARGRFVGWTPWSTSVGSMCAGSSRVCTVTLNANTAVRAVFSPVSLRVAWTDGGTVQVQNPGPSCGSGCYLYDFGTRASIHAQSVGDNAFSGWSGGCANIGDSCDVLMNDNRVLGASFQCTASVCSTSSPLSTTVSFWVKVIGGSVTGSLNCSGSCSKSVSVGQQLSFQASSGRVRWLSRYFTCRTGAQRCTFRVGTNSSSVSPALIVELS
jgi:Divergent InlB B-repeat domain